MLTKFSLQRFLIKSLALKSSSTEGKNGLFATCFLYYLDQPLKILAFTITLATGSMWLHEAKIGLNSFMTYF